MVTEVPYRLNLINSVRPALSFCQGISMQTESTVGDRSRPWGMQLGQSREEQPP